MGDRRKIVVVEEGRRFAVAGGSRAIAVGCSRWLGWGAVGSRGGSGNRVVIVARSRATYISLYVLVGLGWSAKTNLRWVLMRAAIVMLAWVMMAIVRLLPWRSGLRWWIIISLALWLWRHSGRRLLSLRVVGIVWRRWGVVALRVRREVLRSCVVIVGSHVRCVYFSSRGSDKMRTKQWMEEWWFIYKIHKVSIE